MPSLDAQRAAVDPFYDINRRGRYAPFGTPAPQQSTSTTTAGQNYQTAYQTGNPTGIIEQQITETKEAQDKTLKSKQDAINLMIQGIIDRSNLNAEIYRRQNDPNVAKLRTSIQSILDNPNVINDRDTEALRNVIESKRLNLLDATNEDIRSNFAGRGLGTSGVLSGELGKAANQAKYDITSQFINLEQLRKQLAADNLARAQGLGTQLEQYNTGALDSILGIEAGYNNLNFNRNKAIADLMYGIEHQTPDYSGLASLALGQFNANRQDDITRQGLRLQEQELAEAQRQFDFSRNPFSMFDFTGRQNPGFFNAMQLLQGTR